MVLEVLAGFFLVPASSGSGQSSTIGSGAVGAP